MPGWRAVGPSISFVASWSQEGWEEAKAHSDSTAYEMCHAREPAVPCSSTVRWGTNGVHLGGRGACQVAQGLKRRGSYNSAIITVSLHVRHELGLSLLEQLGEGRDGDRTRWMAGVGCRWDR